MEEIKVIIVDDEQICIKILQQLLKKYEEINIVANAKNVDEAIAAILEHQPEIIFLDVQMPGKNGFDLLNEITNFEVQPTIIFVTSHDEYAIKAIRHSAFDYLLKPVEPDELNKAIRRYQYNIKKISDKQKSISLTNYKLLNKIQFKTRYSSLFINPDDIIYAEADGNYAKLYLKNNKYHLISSYLSEVVEKLPPNFFSRISRSIVINLNFLEQIDRKNRICKLECEEKEYQFKFSVNFIRTLEEKIK